VRALPSTITPLLGVDQYKGLSHVAWGLLAAGHLYRDTGTPVPGHRDMLCPAIPASARHPVPLTVALDRDGHPRPRRRSRGMLMVRDRFETSRARSVSCCPTGLNVSHHAGSRPVHVPDCVPLHTPARQAGSGGTWGISHPRTSLYMRCEVREITSLSPPRTPDTVSGVSAGHVRSSGQPYRESHKRRVGKPTPALK